MMNRLALIAILSRITARVMTYIESNDMAHIQVADVLCASARRILADMGYTYGESSNIISKYFFKHSPIDQP